MKQTLQDTVDQEREYLLDVDYNVQLYLICNCQCCRNQVHQAQL